MMETDNEGMCPTCILRHCDCDFEDEMQNDELTMY